MNRRIGIIGVGLVGSALAERFLQAGFEVLGYDLDPRRQEALHRLGGSAVTSASEVIESCEQVVLSLPTSEIASSVLALLQPLVAGKTILDTTTGAPAEMDQIGRELRERGAEYVVATIAGSSAQVRRGEVIAMVGGSEQAVDRCRDLLQSFAKQWFHLGDWAAAARMKLAMNLVIGMNRAVLAEGLAFAQACGIDSQLALEVLKASPGYSRAMDIKGERMLEHLKNWHALEVESKGDLRPPDARLAQHHKDVGLILNEADLAGTEVWLSQAHYRYLGTLVANGWGEADNAAIIELYRSKNRSQEPQ